jgi:hypothetical protein
MKNQTTELCSNCKSFSEEEWCDCVDSCDNYSKFVRRDCRNCGKLNPDKCDKQNVCVKEELWIKKRNGRGFADPR